MKFNFGSGKQQNLKEKIEEVKDDLDLTEGLSEADLRLIVNKLGRAASVFLLANGLAAKEGTIPTPYKEVYSYLCRRGLNYIDAIVGENSPKHIRKVLPFNIT